MHYSYQLLGHRQKIMSNTLRHNALSESVEVKQNIRLHFLCAHHRDWIYFHSAEALSHLDQMQLKGEFLLEHQKWQEALPHVGSAWEITEILLELYSGEKTFLVNRLCCLTLLLNTCLLKLGHKECADQVCEQSAEALRTVLKQLESGSENYDYVCQCIEQLSSADVMKFYLVPGYSNKNEQALH